MTEKLAIYRCRHCGTIVQVLVEGEGELICCGDLMKKMEMNESETELYEKHIPIFEDVDDKTIIKVGAIPHPMSKEHHIEFIEALSEDKSWLKIKFLKHNEEPQMEIRKNCNTNCALEYCNIHGLYKGDRK